MNGCVLFEKLSFVGLRLEFVDAERLSVPVCGVCVYVQSIQPEMFEGMVVPITTFNSFNRNHH